MKYNREDALDRVRDFLLADTQSGETTWQLATQVGHSASKGSKHLNPACSKWRSVVNASLIPSSSMITKLAQSTNPQVLSERSAYNMRARSKRLGVRKTSRTLWARSIRWTALGKSSRTGVRANVFPVSATIQSVNKMEYPAPPNWRQRASDALCKVSRVLRSATQPFVSKNTTLVGIGNFGMAVKVVVEVHCQVRNTRVTSQFSHAPNWVEFFRRTNRRLLRRQLCLHAHNRAFWQLRSSLQDHHSILDCSSIRHKSRLTYTTGGGSKANAPKKGQKFPVCTQWRKISGFGVHASACSKLTFELQTIHCRDLVTNGEFLKKGSDPS